MFPSGIIHVRVAQGMRLGDVVCGGHRVTSSCAIRADELGRPSSLPRCSVSTFASLFPLFFYILPASRSVLRTLAAHKLSDARAVHLLQPLPVPLATYVGCPVRLTVGRGCQVLAGVPYGQMAKNAAPSLGHIYKQARCAFAEFAEKGARQELPRSQARGTWAGPCSPPKAPDPQT